MAEVLAGHGCSWIFEAGAVRVRFHRGLQVPKLLHALGERRVPYEALADVSLTPGKRGTLVMRAVPRQGADALLIAAAGQLKEALDPYRLVLPVEREKEAEEYADLMRSSMDGRGPVARCLVAAPSVPRAFKGWDGQAAFDGEAVRLQWFWSSAAKAKQQAGDQRLTLSEIEGVEWRSPDVSAGCLRFRVRGREAPRDPEQDPASVVFRLGYGATAESLPLAAAVVHALREAPAPVLEPEPDEREPDAREPDEHKAAVAAPEGGDIPGLIRKLGDLRDAGLLTEEEFQAKKVELLSRL
ncbi:DUF4429 domain-containing protein [Spongiactinospora sp. TRM90649]|uniref:DUF4429 domain-containing protein n=1 Tax=Spongiactinospora sp. TRM90649 TaxID=3031114 RepID=UPI0023F83643|nr:DUF4429 domain-containing protein [Spongiactinospora sp. TRM90649]MDF5755340.1 DUF4429 domain-containing protein [Spongiactinospora sp. TRM90649]